jgi:glucokinase
MKISIDLGGTNLRAAIVENGKILQMLSEPTLSSGSESEVMDRIIHMISALRAQGKVEGIGIGVPSVVDNERGIVYNVVGIPSWKEVHLKDILEKETGLPVNIDNDCNCFALGVSAFGEAKGFRDAVCVTLGTGVGSGIIVDGRLYRGHNTGAGEIGSLPYLDKDYEYYCSSRLFVGCGTTGKAAADAAAAGDPDALKIWNEFGAHMGDLVKLTMFAYDPGVIVFGGSISAAWPLFEKPMLAGLSTFPYPTSLSRLTLRRTTLPNPGILGASLLIK